MEITKKELEKIYKQNSVEKACKMLKISAPTLFKYLKCANIPLKGKSRPAALKIK